MIMVVEGLCRMGYGHPPWDIELQYMTAEI